MRESLHRVEISKLRSSILPLLKGRAFHVTDETAYQSILAKGRVCTNRDERYQFTYAFSKLSYFRQRGCVSVCDLRNATESQIAEGLDRYNFLHPRSDHNTVVHLLLGNIATRSLVTWEQATQADGLTIQGVPHIESGHPGPIPIADLDEALVVNINCRDDPMLDALRAAGRPVRPPDAP